MTRTRDGVMQGVKGRGERRPMNKRMRTGQAEDRIRSDGRTRHNNSGSSACPVIGVIEALQDTILLQIELTLGTINKWLNDFCTMDESRWDERAKITHVSQSCLLRGVRSRRPYSANKAFLLAVNEATVVCLSACFFYWNIFDEFACTEKKQCKTIFIIPGTISSNSYKQYFVQVR